MRRQLTEGGYSSRVNPKSSMSLDRVDQQDCIEHNLFTQVLASHTDYRQVSSGEQSTSGHRSAKYKDHLLRLSS